MPQLVSHMPQVRALALDLATELHILKQVQPGAQPLDVAPLQDAVKPALMATLQTRLAEAGSLVPSRDCPLIRTRAIKATELLAAAQRLEEAARPAGEAGRPASVPDATSTSYRNTSTSGAGICIRAISADHMSSTLPPSPRLSSAVRRKGASRREAAGLEKAGRREPLVSGTFGLEKDFARAQTLDETDERLLDWIEDDA